MELEQMMARFKDIISKAQNFDGNFGKVIEAMELIDISTAAIWDEYHNYSRVYLLQLVELFGVNEVSDLITDDWFWAEWKSSECCFMFVYGYTSDVREELVEKKRLEEVEQLIPNKSMVELKDMLEELSKETDDFGPEEIDLFTYELGYYSCKAELGLDVYDCEYDQERLEQVKDVYAEQFPNKDRR